MSTKQLAKIEKVGKTLSVALPGGVWTKTGFMVFDSATEAQLCDTVSQMNALNLSCAWALGDLGIAIQERKQKEYFAEAGNLRERAKKTDDAEAKARLLEKADELEGRLPQYTKELAELLGVDSGYWRNCVSLARFYEPSFRMTVLTPTHHIAAMHGAGGSSGNVATAREWMEQATRDALTASELRKRVNQALATSRKPAKPAEGNPFKALDAADQWCIANKALEVKAEHRAALRTRFQALIDWLRKLEG